MAIKSGLLIWNTSFQHDKLNETINAFTAGVASKAQEYYSDELGPCFQLGYLEGADCRRQIRETWDHSWPVHFSSRVSCHGKMIWLECIGILHIISVSWCFSSTMTPHDIPSPCRCRSWETSSQSFPMRLQSKLSKCWCNNYGLSQLKIIDELNYIIGREYMLLHPVLLTVSFWQFMKQKLLLELNHAYRIPIKNE